MVRILITSGNSKIGFRALQALAALGEKDVVVGARDVAASEKKLKAAGAKDVVYVDLAKKESLAAAFKGVERAVLVAGSPGPNESLELYAKNFVDAAKAAGTVNFITRVSALGANPQGQGVSVSQGRADALLRVSGLNYVIFEPTFFMSNPLVNSKQSFQSGQHMTGAGQGRTAWVAPEDIGAVVGTVLSNPLKTKINAGLPITGPAAITDDEMIGAIAKALGKEVKINHVSLDEQEKVLQGYGLPPFVVSLIRQLDTIRLNNWAAGVVDTVALMTGRPAQSAQEWAQEHAKEYL